VAGPPRWAHQPEALQPRQLGVKLVLLRARRRERRSALLQRRCRRRQRAAAARHARALVCGHVGDALRRAAVRARDRQVAALPEARQQRQQPV
jgi:hypothetical protein